MDGASWNKEGGGGEMCGVGVSVSGYDLYVTGVLLTC